ncbi:hypothetical protein BpHYR1_044822 [Brachionus plicatilis]|uniref:Uncharacterized protein n=1 Tax=Brachionus plicatilis TaxID=10195 RepID=A0A3M7P8T1_BRAPC|nr:hypothetical protein BpHYR1_044822 [Brachionus plicatilis]
MGEIITLQCYTENLLNKNYKIFSLTAGRPNVRPFLKRAATLAARPAAKNLDRGLLVFWTPVYFGGPKIRPPVWPPKWPSVLKLAVHLAGRQRFGRPTPRSKFLASGLAAKVAVRLYNRPSRRILTNFLQYIDKYYILKKKKKL